METFGVLFLVVVVPLWIIFHYSAKMKEQKIMKPEEESNLGEMRYSAERLEDRLRSLERILDDEVPGWRNRYNG